jgi:hypothetical protein
MPMFRLEQPLVQPCLVTQQQQSLAIGIEPANWIHTLRKPKFRERPKV